MTHSPEAIMNAVTQAREQTREASRADDLARAARFDEAFTLHHRAVYRAAYGLLRDAGLAEDVTQEVFIKLYHHFDSAPRQDFVNADGRESSCDALRAWLLRVAINDARNVIRGRSRAAAREDAFMQTSAPALNEWTASAPDEDYERKTQIAEARRALSKIGEPMRSCLMLKQQGLSYKEIASALSINEASVGSYVARGRKEFARLYGKIGGR